MSGRGPRLISVKRGITLGAMELGTLVKLNENGTPAEFYVACHNYEAGLNGNGRTLVVRKDCYDMRAFSIKKSPYSSSDLNAFLVGTYSNLLDAGVRDLVGTTKFYSTDAPTLERSVFQLSVTELMEGNDSGAPKEGSILPIASLLRVAHLNGTAFSQWARTPFTSFPGFVYCLDNIGMVSAVGFNNRCGSRPAFTLPASTLVGDDLLIA